MIMKLKELALRHINFKTTKDKCSTSRRGGGKFTLISKLDTLQFCLKAISVRLFQCRKDSNASYYQVKLSGSVTRLISKSLSYWWKPQGWMSKGKIMHGRGGLRCRIRMAVCIQLGSYVCFTTTSLAMVDTSLLLQLCSACWVPNYCYWWAMPKFQLTQNVEADASLVLYCTRP